MDHDKKDNNEEHIRQIKRLGVFNDPIVEMKNEPEGVVRDEKKNILAVIPARGNYSVSDGYGFQAVCPSPLLVGDLLSRYMEDHGLITPYDITNENSTSSSTNYDEESKNNNKFTFNMIKTSSDHIVELKETEKNDGKGGKTIVSESQLLADHTNPK